VKTRNTSVNKNNVDNKLSDLLFYERFVNRQESAIQQPFSLSEGQQRFYKRFVEIGTDESKEIFFETYHWKIKYDRIRICASEAYSFYTYLKNKSPNWNKKAEITLNKGKQSAKERHEYLAKKQAFQKLEKDGVGFKMCGVYISPNFPFLACHVDGIYEGERKVLKVYSPANGHKFPMKEFVNIENNTVKLHEFELIEGNLRLKRKTKLYMDVQLQMHFSNSTSCDIYIYTSFDQEHLKLNVPFDNKYSDMAINSIGFIYFSKLIPILEKLHEESNDEKQLEESSDEKQLEKNEDDVKILAEKRLRTGINCMSIENDELIRSIHEFDCEITTYLKNFREVIKHTQ
jgi:hypothetical protein